MNSDEINKMIVEIVTEKPHTLEGPEAEEIYAQLEAEIAEMQRQGIDVEVPFEVPEL